MSVHIHSVHCTKCANQFQLKRDQRAITMASSSPSSNVDLGFLEECQSWLLTNRYFPSKVGGKPAWLELADIPALNEIKCRKCQEVMVFLCQVYASQDDTEHCFHRTLYVFVCKNASCWQENCSK